MTPIFSNEVRSSFLSKDQQILIYESNHLIINRKTDLIKDLLINTSELIQDHIIIGELVNITDLGGNFRSIMDFLVKIYYPKMQCFGMKKAAYILKKDLIIENLMDKLCKSNRVKTNSFYSEHEAISWPTSNSN